MQHTRVCNYADDTTIYTCYSDLDTVINRVETETANACEMVLRELHELNDEKCHLMIFGNDGKVAIGAVGKSTIKDSEFEKRLGVTFDKKLSFTKHVEDLCKETH